MTANLAKKYHLNAVSRQKEKFARLQPCSDIKPQLDTNTGVVLTPGATSVFPKGGKFAGRSKTTPTEETITGIEGAIRTLPACGMVPSINER